MKPKNPIKDEEVSQKFGAYLKTEFCQIAGEEVDFYENGKVIGEHLMLDPSLREFNVTLDLIERIVQQGNIIVTAKSAEEAKAKAITAYIEGEYDDEFFNMRDTDGHYGYEVDLSSFKQWETEVVK